MSKRKSQRQTNTQRILWVLSLLLAASMVISLILVALPEPGVSTPTPRPTQPPTATSVPAGTPASATAPALGPELPTPSATPTPAHTPSGSAPDTRFSTRSWARDGRSA